MGGDDDFLLNTEGEVVVGLKLPPTVVVKLLRNHPNPYKRWRQSGIIKLAVCPPHNLPLQAEPTYKTYLSRATCHVLAQPVFVPAERVLHHKIQQGVERVSHIGIVRVMAPWSEGYLRRFFAFYAV